MKSTFRRLAAVALMACAASLAYVDRKVFDPVAMAYRAVKRAVSGWVRRALAVVAPKQVLDLNPVSIFAAVKSFYLRIVRRQRPHVTPGWRWVPST
jgi:hypothetical protein